VLAADPFELAERHRRPYGELLVAVGRSPDTVVARAAWLALPAWSSWLPELTPDALRRLGDLTETHVWRAVLPAVIGQVDAGSALPLLPEVLLGLAALDATDPTRDDPARDRPARRRLDELVRELIGWARRNPVREATALREAGLRLAELPEFVPQAAALLLAAVRLTEPAEAELAAICGLVSDRPVTAAGLADQLAQRVATGTPEILLAAGQRLAGRGDLAGGLFARALATAGRELGWPVEWRALVANLRRSPQPDVRAAALLLATAEE
jgi:hypothetical protein